MSLSKNQQRSLIDEPKVVLSTLWIFVLMNMIYADILNTLKPTYLSELDYVGKNISGEMVLLFAFFMEIPIIMILLSRVLKRKANRVANFMAAPFSILWVIVPSIVMGDSPTPLSYLFFATIETTTMTFILWYAWKWQKTNP
jgi:hypothetical protein